MPFGCRKIYSCFFSCTLARESQPQPKCSSMLVGLSFYRTVENMLMNTAIAHSTRTLAKGPFSRLRYLHLTVVNTNVCRIGVETFRYLVTQQPIYRGPWRGRKTLAAITATTVLPPAARYVAVNVLRTMCYLCSTQAHKFAKSSKFPSRARSQHMITRRAKLTHRRSSGGGKPPLRRKNHV